MSKKAPGEDIIPNLILKLPIGPLLLHLYPSSYGRLSLGFFPLHFQSSITIVLRKPVKADYTTAKADRPIALHNTLGKALKLVLAKRITYLTENYVLVSPS